MSEFVVPPLDEEWPSLGSEVVAWMEANLVFGPGDLLGQPYRLDEEDRAIVEAAYQVFPKEDSRAGHRRFDTFVLMTRKGTKKSERLAAFSAVELAEDGPVRFDGWRKVGKQWVPVGRPVTSPYVWILAFSEQQAEDTSFEAMRQMIVLGPGADKFDVWEDRIVRRGGVGQAMPLASAPDSRDGGKTTFQGKEESHRWVLPRQREAHQTTRGNLSKRPIAEPWEMHATTAYAPGEGSVAEELHDAARKLTGDEARASRMFFFYRWADTRIQIRNEDGSIDRRALLKAIDDASGPVASKWSPADNIASMQFLAPGADPEYAERVWLNRTLRRTAIAFDVEVWKHNARPTYRIPDKALVTLGFDGSRGTSDPRRPADHTGLIATELVTGHQQVLGHWVAETYEDRQIPRAEVDMAVDDAFSRFEVLRLYADPPGWDPEIALWVGRYGKERVFEWFTWRERAMGFACSNYAQAIALGLVTNDGHAEFTAHIGHAHQRLVNIRDDDGRRVWVIQKEREGSPLKIDLASAGVLSWEARTDAIAAGALEERPSVFEERGLVTV